MSSRIEQGAQIVREAGAGQEHDRERGDAFAAAVQMMSASPLTMLIAPRSDETSQFARAAAIACAGLRDRPADGKCGDVVVIFDQWAGDPLLALGEAIAAALSSASGTRLAPPRANRRALDELLALWAERFDARFIIVLDQYERNLAAEPLNAPNARFAEQLAAAITHAAPHSRFLVVVSDESEAALPRLTARLASPCSNVVRLAAAPAVTHQTDFLHPAENAATAPAGERDEPLPEGFSALADDRVDLTATTAILRRRQRRQDIARWRNVGIGAALLIATAAGIALFLRLQASDPGARLARALDPQAAPVVPAPTSASGASATADTAPAPSQPPAPAAGSVDAAKAEPASPALVVPPAVVPLEPAAQSDHKQSPPAPPTTLPVPAAVEPLPAAAPAAPVAAIAPIPPIATVAPSVPALTTATTLSRSRDATPPEMPKRDPPPPALRVDAPPGPPVPAKLVRGIANPEKEPMLFIHIRSESQRAQARNIASGLARLSIVVSGVRVEESGPLRGDLRYYRSGERDEANYLARALAKLGTPGLRVTQVAGHEAAAVPRHYELWLPPPTR